MKCRCMEIFLHAMAFFSGYGLDFSCMSDLFSVL